MFKQVIPNIALPVLHRIHQTYRLQLLRDVLLPRALDDQCLSTITSMTFVNSTNVLSWFSLSMDLVDALYAAGCVFSRLHLLDLVLLVMPVCVRSKNG